jgi:hypothetical protein
MDQLTVRDLIYMLEEIRKDQEMTKNELLALPIYLGRDDELNGIHTGWCVDILDTALTNPNDKYLIEMINEDRTNVPIKGKAILIS